MHATFAALAEPNRFRIVELLLSGARPVGEIGDQLNIRQPQVSKHLKVLKEAGLVDMQPHAQQRVYELRPAPIRELHAWTERYRQLWEERFTQMDEVLEELKRSESGAVGKATSGHSGRHTHNKERKSHASKNRSRFRQ
ncbi:MAG: metalloregulator ArsR/SmtB family transcription factor [Myxococcota bacterium]